jgi:hypothetical protein
MYDTYLVQAGRLAKGSSLSTLHSTTNASRSQMYFHQRQRRTSDPESVEAKTLHANNLMRGLEFDSEDHDTHRSRHGSNEWKGGEGAQG